MNTFLNPDKWTEECPWYQRACIHSNCWIQRKMDRLPWVQIRDLRAAYRSAFSNWRKTAQYALALEEENVKLKAERKILVQLYSRLYHRYKNQNGLN